MAKTVKNRKNTAHTIYKNAEGKRLPSVTTITGLLDKPQLRAWANRIGLDGIELGSYMDDLANVGTLAHAMIQAHFTGEQVDMNEYSKNDIDRAENAMISFLNWVQTMPIKPVLNEAKLVNGEFGGTVDMYCQIGDKKCLVDFKTGSGIFEEMGYQLAGYKILLEANGHKVDQAMIVRVGRDEQEGFEVRTFSEMEKFENVFKHLLAIYHLRRK
jgi:hypothetical protein